MTSDPFVPAEAARLLVVDDDPILREFAQASLASDMVSVEVAEDGDVAWRRLQQGGIDIALVDLEMPVMDGFELIRRMRLDEALRHTPVIVATSRNDMIAVDGAYAAGATSFVLKPLNWRVISHQLAYVLRSSREAARIRAKARALRQALRAQDQVLSICHDRIDNVLRMMLDGGGAIEPGTPLFAQVWEELQRLSSDMREKSI